MGVDRIARAWGTLMTRLGYRRYVAQGGDCGAFVTAAIGVARPEGCAGIHLNTVNAPCATARRLTPIRRSVRRLR